MRRERGPISRRLRASAATLKVIAIAAATIPHAGSADATPSDLRTRPAVLHWIGEYPGDHGGGWHWSRCPLDADGEPSGEPVAHRLLANPDNPQDPSPLTPIDIATTSHGDVVISHVQGNGAVRVFVEGDPANWFDVSLGTGEAPFGVATHPTKRTGYVVTRSGLATSPDAKSKLWSFSTARSDAQARNIATWDYGGELTGLDFSRGSFYFALSQWEDGSLVGRLRTGRTRTEFKVVARQKKSPDAEPEYDFVVYAVAFDPGRRLVHFAVAGSSAVYTLRLRADGRPSRIDLRPGEAAGSVPTSAPTSQISRSAARDRVVWAQFEDDNTPDTAGIYHARILGPKDASEPKRILGAFRPRAAVIHVPRRAAPRAVDEVR